MKKIFFTLIISLTLIISFTTDIFADTILNNDKEFEYTINDFSKSTFDSSINIAGSCENGTVVTFDVSNNNGDKSYSCEVKKTEIFCKSIVLAVGKNDVEITFEKDGYDAVSEEFTVVRLSEDVKKELEQYVCVPKYKTGFWLSVK